MKQTAVEQFAIALYEGGYLQGNGDEIEKLLNTFQEMHKEEMCEFAYKFETRNNLKSAEQIFDETYGGNN